MVLILILAFFKFFLIEDLDLNIGPKNLPIKYPIWDEILYPKILNIKNRKTISQSIGEFGKEYPSTRSYTSYTELFRVIFGRAPDKLRQKWLNSTQDATQCNKIIQLRLNPRSDVDHLIEPYTGYKPSRVNLDAARDWYIDNMKCYICNKRLNLSGLSTAECEHVLPIFLALRHLWIVRSDFSSIDPEHHQIINLEYE